MTRAERLLVPGLPEHRVDTLPYALIAIDRVLTAGGIRDMAWSRYALKEGAAARMCVLKNG
jgi:exopolyphosphatase/pppGpp-phosphohydrolase